MKYLKYIILAIILLIGFTLRFYDIQNIPTGFFADEVSIGYNAYTMLIKGTDEYGISYPLFFRAFGEFKSPVEIYSTVPSIALFGLNEFSVRLPSAIFGTATIIAIYFLTKELLSKYKNKKTIALIAALLLAISPWHIHFSRIAFEMMPFVLFTTLGVYLFLKAQENIHLLLLSTVSFAIAIYSYFPARIFIPLFCLGIFCTYYNFLWQHKKEIILNFALTLVLLMPLIAHSLSPVGLSRWQQVNVFSHPPKNESISQHILNNYVGHFSFNFLFLKGDIDMPGQFITRQSVRGIGELYLFQLPLIVLGLIFLVRKRMWKYTIILFLWLILYPIGSMFTTDQSAQATRSIIGVIPFQIISAVGLYYLINLISKLGKLLSYISAFIIFIIIFLSFINYISLYFVKYFQYSSDFWGWQYGPREIMTYFLQSRDSYQDLYMSGDFNAGQIFISFYDPKNLCKNKCRIGDFHSQPKIYNPLRKQLFAINPQILGISLIKGEFFVRKIIYYPNNTIAFLIGEIVQ
jgi:4-amino-4-deoxy-L-arabinose transferase-like glycosyltransferase